MICQNPSCGVELPRSHSNRRTCSGACRTALHRLSKLIAKPISKPDRRKRARLPRYAEGLIPEKSIVPPLVHSADFVLPEVVLDSSVTCQGCGREMPVSHSVRLHSLELARQRIAGAKEWERELKARLDVRHETGEDPAMLRRLIKDAVWCQGPMYRYPVPVTRGCWSCD